MKNCFYRFLLRRKVRVMITNKKKTALKNVGIYLLFAGPTMFVFIAVVVIPLIYGFVLTLTDWNGISKNMNFIGFTNYVSLAHDTKFWYSISLTALYTIVCVLLVNIVAFLLAYILTIGIRGEKFLRAGFFIPYLIGGITLGYIWQFVFSKVIPDLYNVIPVALFEKSWLSSTGTSFAALVIVTIWQYAGYMMLIYITGIVSISPDIIEAGKIDGASGAQMTRYVRIPLMVSSFVVCIFLTITRCFKVYDLNMALTGGDPFGTTQLVSMHIYTKAFEDMNYGVGQAEALVLFVIVAVNGIVQVTSGKKKEVEV